MDLFKLQFTALDASRNLALHRAIAIKVPSMRED